MLRPLETIVRTAAANAITSPSNEGYSILICMIWCHKVSHNNPFSAIGIGRMKMTVGNLSTCLGRGLHAAWLLPALIAAFGLIPAGRASAQPLKTLYSFGAVPDGGSQPNAGLVLSGNTFYGTTYQGGSSGFGTVFAVNTDGSGYTNLYSFTNGSDGANPSAGLILSGNTLYGTALYGGSSNCGTIFAIDTDGSDFTNLYSFTGCTNGAYPSAGLVLSGGTLYGVTGAGIFVVNTNGTGFTNLYNFSGDAQCDGLVLSGAILYGMVGVGGTNNFGTVFAANTAGSGFTNLYTFNDGSDGANPYVGLILSGGTLYGTTSRGGPLNDGTVFAINTDGTGFTNLYNFTNGSNGSSPRPGLVLSGNTLYGTAEFGSDGVGTVFSVSTNGIGFTDLYTFTGGNDGVLPAGGLILSGNSLYGTAVTGGTSGGGTMFSILLSRPQLAITLSGANVVLTWPASAVSFTLESTTNLLAAAWSTNLPVPVVINGQNVVTNPITGTQQFYQLIQ
jgi:uncharacterized repeat protein (TIGR03803 family)